MEADLRDGTGGRRSLEATLRAALGFYLPLSLRFGFRFPVQFQEAMVTLSPSLRTVAGRKLAVNSLLLLNEPVSEQQGFAFSWTCK